MLSGPSLSSLGSERVKMDFPIVGDLETFRAVDVPDKDTPAHYSYGLSVYYRVLEAAIFD